MSRILLRICYIYADEKFSIPDMNQEKKLVGEKKKAWKLPR